MRKKRFLRRLMMSVLSMGICLIMTSCNNDDEKTCYCEANIISTVNDISGTMHYNSLSGRWFIMTAEPRTIDSVTNYYPKGLSKEFQVEGMKVTFSGDLYHYQNDPSLVPSSYEEYCIDLLDISGDK